jgi:hypothetical protein
MRKKWNSMNTTYLSIVVLGIPVYFLDNNIEKPFNRFYSEKEEVILKLGESKKLCLEDYMVREYFKIKFREYNISSNSINYYIDDSIINSKFKIISRIHIKGGEIQVKPINIGFDNNEKYKIKFEIRY